MAKKKTTKKAAPAKAPTKSQVIGAIADDTGLTKKEVAAVFESLGAQIKKNLGRRGAGVFTIPGLCKLTLKKVPAKPRRKGINPFTKEEQWFAAKPARKDVKIRALKALKDMVK